MNLTSIVAQFLGSKFSIFNSHAYNSVNTIIIIEQNQCSSRIVRDAGTTRLYSSAKQYSYGYGGGGGPDIGETGPVLPKFSLGFCLVL